MKNLTPFSALRNAISGSSAEREEVARNELRENSSIPRLVASRSLVSEQESEEISRELARERLRESSPHFSATRKLLTEEERQEILRERLETSFELPFHDDEGNFLSDDERMQIAKKSGRCFPCGRPTHVVKDNGVRVAIMNKHVYQGCCLNCYPEKVPAMVRHHLALFFPSHRK